VEDFIRLLRYGKGGGLLDNSIGGSGPRADWFTIGAAGRVGSLMAEDAMVSGCFAEAACLVALAFVCSMAFL